MQAHGVDLLAQFYALNIFKLFLKILTCLVITFFSLLPFVYMSLRFLVFFFFV